MEAATATEHGSAGLVLGQQELVPPDPIRSVSGPEKAEYFWGIDPGATTTALAVSDGRQRDVWSFRVDPRMPVGQRLGEIYGKLYELCRAKACVYPPAFVWVEQIAVFSKRIEPVAYYAAGVALAAAFDSLHELYEWPVHVEDVPVAQWKKRGLGNGAAKKPVVLAWARELTGRPDLLQDEADALGIAEAAARSVEFEAA